MTKKQIGAAIQKARAGKQIPKRIIQRKQLNGIEKGETAYTIDSLLTACRAVGLEVCVLPKGAE